MGLLLAVVLVGPLAGCSTSATAGNSDVAEWQTVGLGLEGRNSYAPTLAWTGDVLFVLDTQTPNGDVYAALYDPSSQELQQLELDGLEWRGRYEAAWTGESITIWGGLESPLVGELAPEDLTWRTSPVTSTPSSPAVWTGSHLVSWSGGGLVALDTATGSVAALPSSPLGLRRDPIVVWTGEEIVVWGGCSGPQCDDVFTGTDELTDGAVFVWDTQEWHMMAEAPLGPRDGPEGVWTGAEVIIWGGDYGGDGVQPGGAGYTPATNRWRTLSEAPLEPRRGHTVTAWDSRVLVWGGSGEIVPVNIEEGVYDVEYFGDGAVYSSEADSWTYIPSGPLEARDRHRAIQIGQGIMITGGCCPAGASGILTEIFDPADRS